MSARITITPGSPPREQIQDQLRGLIASGILPPNERLPSVRQLALDLGVAPGTVAKAYKALEADGHVITRIGGGTRVNPETQSTPEAVLDAARILARRGAAAGISFDDASNILSAVWQEEK